MKLTGAALDLLEKFEQAVRAEDHSGSLPPEEISLVHSQYLIAKDELTDYIYKLQALAYE